MNHAARLVVIPRRWRTAAWSTFIGVVAAAAGFCLPHYITPIRQNLSTLDTASYNWMYNHRAAEAQPTNLCIVEINKNAIQNLGAANIPYPFPRIVHARVIRNLKAAGARVVGIDILFNSLKEPSGDRELAKTMADCGNVVLAADFASSAGADTPQSSSGEDFPAAIFRESALSFGPVDIPQDDGDGWVRRFALTRQHLSLTDIRTDGEDYPHFAACVAAAYRGIPVKQLARDLSHRMFAGHYIPPSDDYWEAFAPGKSARICFVGRPMQSCPFMPYDQVYDASPAGPDLAAFNHLKNMVGGKIVLIGSTEESEHDNFYTPLQERDDPKRPGVEIQADIVHTLLSHHYYSAVPEWIRRLLLCTAALLTAWITQLLRPVRGGIAVLLLLLVGAWFDTVLFSHRIFLRPVGVASAAAAAYVGETLYLYLIEDTRSRQLRRQFGRYVGPRVMERVLDAGHVDLEGEYRHVAIMFTDLEGFTSLSESLTPKEAVDILNAYLARMVDCIFKYEGTLDKIMGDGIMAYFGAPNTLENPELQAVRCAVEMQKVMREWRREGSIQGMPALRKRIGIHSGPVIVGEIGSANQVGYTIIGDPVNVTARLEPLNKDYGTEILISEDVQARLPDNIKGSFRGQVPIRGRKEPIRVYSVDVSPDET